MHIEAGFRPARRYNLLMGIARKLASQSLDQVQQHFLTTFATSGVFDGNRPFTKMHSALLNVLPMEDQVIVKEVLASMNRLEGPGVAPTIVRRTDVTLTWEECVYEVMVTKLPTPATGDTGNGVMRQAELALHCARYVQELQRLEGRKAMVEECMDQAVNHLLWRVEQENGMDSLSQHERSLLILRFHPFYSMNEDGTYKPLPTPQYNPLAVPFLEPLFSRVLPGPKSDYQARVSTRDRTRLAMSITPYRAKITTSRGFIMKCGAESQLDLDPSLEWQWDMTEHLNAVAERGLNVLFAPGDYSFNCVPVNFYFGPLGDRSSVRDANHFFPDDPGIKWQYDSARQTLEMIFISDYLDGKQVRTSDWGHYLLHLAMQPDKIKETPVVADTLDKYPVAYLDMLYASGDVLAFDPKAVSPETHVDILYWKDANARAQSKAGLSRSPLPAQPILGWATHFVRPCFRGFACFTHSQLFVTDDAAVDHFLSYLGLDRIGRAVNRVPAALCWRHYILTKIHGQTPYALEDTICIMTNGRI